MCDDRRLADTVTGVRSQPAQLASTRPLGDASCTVVVNEEERNAPKPSKEKIEMMGTVTEAPRGHA